MGEIEFYDSEQLIYEVEKRPTLYDKNSKDYNDKNVREKLWREVCEAIIPNWNELLNREFKEKTARDVQRKWKNIRDCFRKELNNEKKCKTGQGGKRKRRKYIFYDRLLFLLPSMKDSKSKQCDSENSGEEAEENNAEVEETEYKPPVWKPRGRSRHPIYLTYEESPNNDTETIVEEIKDKSREEVIDEDKYFLLSLVPAFKNLTPEQKFSAKIDFLKILRNLSYPTLILRPGSPSFSEHSIANPKQENVDF